MIGYLSSSVKVSKLIWYAYATADGGLHKYATTRSSIPYYHPTVEFLLAWLVWTIFPSS